MTNKIKYVADNSDLTYCILKTIEELFELGEVLSKQLTKPDGADSEERVAKVVEESGDVLFNVRVLVSKMELSMQVLNRVEEKALQCVKRIDKQLKDNKDDFFVEEDEY